MKTLWTPWRMEYVGGLATQSAGCLFEPPGSCRFSRADLLLYRDNQVLVLLNRFPYANGHLLVAPIRHVGCITELTLEENNRLGEMVRECSAILKRIYSPDGLNIGMNIGSTAGAGIAAHLHVHLVPRWDGDHNFMTVLAEVRTIPEHIEAAFDRLLPEFSQLQPR